PNAAIEKVGSRYKSNLGRYAIAWSKLGVATPVIVYFGRRFVRTKSASIPCAASSAFKMVTWALQSPYRDVRISSAGRDVNPPSSNPIPTYRICLATQLYIRSAFARSSTASPTISDDKRCTASLGTAIGAFQARITLAKAA